MSWFDHEELKSPENRSDRYKETFPMDYEEGMRGQIWDREKQKWVEKKQEKIMDKPNVGEIVEPRDFAFHKPTNTWRKKPWTRATEENWAGDLRGLYEGEGFEYYPSANDKEMFEITKDIYPDKDDPDLITNKSLYALVEENHIQTVKTYKKIPENSKFNETELLRQVEDYIAGTYGEHYSQGDIQIFEAIAANGHGEGFACGNIEKLAARYGKKHGYNRDDLLKIAHYAILLLWDHDKNKRK